MIFLKVPYAEKDEAKALGARWNSQRKLWYVPDGQAAAPFEKWITAGAGAEAAAGAKPGRVDSMVGKTSIGANYLELKHDCNPFTDCAECRPQLESSGWLEKQQAARLLSRAPAPGR